MNAPGQAHATLHRTLVLGFLCLSCGGPEPHRPRYAAPDAHGKKQVVHLTFDGEVPERSTPTVLGTGEVRSLYEWTSLLDDLRRDSDVAAIFLEIRTIGCGWASTEELAGAFEAVRRSGRKVHCAIEELDDREYLFAVRACDTTSMEAAGTLGLDRLARQELFLREPL